MASFCALLTQLAEMPKSMQFRCVTWSMPFSRPPWAMCSSTTRVTNLSVDAGMVRQASDSSNSLVSQTNGSPRGGLLRWLRRLSALIEPDISRRLGLLHGLGVADAAVAIPS
jgi:hypothetical protein